MTIEQAFKQKFNELFPTVSLFPLVAPTGAKGFFSVYVTENRGSVRDLSFNVHQYFVDICLYTLSNEIVDLNNFTWELFSFEEQDGRFYEGSPNVQRITITQSIDEYFENEGLYANKTILHITFTN